MAKYHINAKGEVKPCRAQVKCRFGGASGKENHFTNKNQAEKVAQMNFSAQFGETSAVRKNFINQKDAEKTLKTLSDKGVRVKNVDSVNDFNFNNSKDYSVSNIDVLDEKPNKEWLNSIRRGNLKAFN